MPPCATSAASRARVEIGTSRSLPPLPRTVTSGVSLRSEPCGSVTNSLARRPEEYSSSIAATASGARAAGSRAAPSISASTSASVSAFGRLAGRRGLSSSAVGSSARNPSRARKRKNCRMAESFRAWVRAARPAAASPARCAWQAPASASAPYSAKKSARSAR